MAWRRPSCRAGDRFCARLKRLEKKIKLIEPADPGCRFRVDPALAKASRDDHLRANKLEQNFTTVAEWRAVEKLRELNLERAD
jgi:hypothetical protein